MFTTRLFLEMKRWWTFWPLFLRWRWSIVNNTLIGQTALDDSCTDLARINSSGSCLSDSLNLISTVSPMLKIRDLGYWPWLRKTSSLMLTLISTFHISCQLFSNWIRWENLRKREKEVTLRSKSMKLFLCRFGDFFLNSAWATVQISLTALPLYLSTSSQSLARIFSASETLVWKSSPLWSNTAVRLKWLTMKSKRPGKDSLISQWTMSMGLSASTLKIQRRRNSSRRWRSKKHSRQGN